MYVMHPIVCLRSCGYASTLWHFIASSPTVDVYFLAIVFALCVRMVTFVYVAHLWSARMFSPCLRLARTTKTLSGTNKRDLYLSHVLFPSFTGPEPFDLLIKMKRFFLFPPMFLSFPPNRAHLPPPTLSSGGFPTSRDCP
jgi:hypothetical protein